ncbi:GNAT family N-acetyltransferase [Microbacterium amylolyticum]|uniref:Ribosomal protein S18 acetylase RimI-like enzyme n=1 Tax=Microbacterium amylolyticum TaxID=936337 RepID=A0ABS4ZI55_9MICO|nr:GNAT family N-acetyltransferase [Microbacterium amylolyticum]MBP2436955.1 ribosomal protein S18 acetylase RimI-like enzyme [Microbacterium amylolyticum]
MITPPLDVDTSALDNPAWSALTGAHARFSIGGDRVKRYQDDVSPFLGVSSWEDPLVWSALIDMHGPAATVTIAGADPALPDGWSEVWRGAGVQMIETDRVITERFDEAVELGAEHVAEMLAIVERNAPGPFLPRTHELGRYIGVIREGRLVAMAGERLRPAGWTEISAVSVDESHRRQGLASRLVLDVAHGIRARGDRAFLHAAETNTGAVAAYERIGFEVRTRVPFISVRTPGAV